MSTGVEHYDRIANYDGKEGVRVAWMPEGVMHVQAALYQLVLD